MCFAKRPSPNASSAEAFGVSTQTMAIMACYTNAQTGFCDIFSMSIGHIDSYRQVDMNSSILTNCVVKVDDDDDHAMFRKERFLAHIQQHSYLYFFNRRSVLTEICRTRLPLPSVEFH